MIGARDHISPALVQGMVFVTCIVYALASLGSSVDPHAPHFRLIPPQTCMCTWSDTPVFCITTYQNDFETFQTSALLTKRDNTTI